MPESPEIPEIAELARLAAGVLLALATGRAALAAAGLGMRSAWARLGLALALGVGLLVIIGLPLALLGLPAGPLPIAGLALALTAALVAISGVSGVARRRSARPADPEPLPAAGHPALATAGGAVLAAALGLALAKIAVAPLWSWDHFAVWGVKSRHLVAGGRLDLGVLAEPALAFVAHYPLGLPAAWRLLALGGMPGELAVKLVHALVLLALVGVAHDACRRLAGQGPLATALAALLAASPLAWDTVAVGLADLPLALWATAGLAAALAARGGPPLAAAPAGLLLGFLPWLKDEGVVLSLLAAGAAALLLGRSGNRTDARRRLLSFAAPWAATFALARLVARAWLPEGEGFFTGDWWDRGLARLAEPGPIVAALARDLADPGWLGLWLLFAGALVAAALRRTRRMSAGSAALALGAVVVAALAVYAGVYFVTVFDPVMHVRSSFARVAAALAPLAILAIAAAAAPADPV